MKNQSIMAELGIGGGTKKREYYRTIEMLEEIINNPKYNTKANIMYLLYFLSDSGYERNDIKEIAEMIEEGLK